MIKLVNRNEVGFSHVVNEALKHNLFVPDFTFYEMLTEYTDNIIKLCILYDEEPIGLGMVWRYPQDVYVVEDCDHIGCFVKPEYRRKGHGSKIVAALGGTKGLMWRPGETQDSGLFWLEMDK